MKVFIGGEVNEDETEKLVFVPAVKKVVKNVVIVEVDTIIVDDEMEGL